jgi:hypothetical protein
VALPGFGLWRFPQLERVEQRADWRHLHRFSTDKILDNIESAFMAAFEAHNGRWGVLTDFIYLNLGASKQGSRNFSFGGSPIDASTSANLDFDLKGTIWTLAGEYRVYSAPALQADLLAGFRMSHLEHTLRWDISGALGNLPPASRLGSAQSSETLWDAIVGVKGRYAFGSGQRWSVPFYVDVGAGGSDLTWQAAAGVGYEFSWSEVTLLWRYLAYEMKSGRPLQDLKFSGPMLGATFKF